MNETKWGTWAQLWMCKKTNKLTNKPKKTRVYELVGLKKLIYMRKFQPKFSPKKSNPRIEGVLFSSAPFIVMS